MVVVIVMSDKMQMQQCCVVVTVRLGRGGQSKGVKGETGWAKHWACCVLASVKSEMGLRDGGRVGASGCEWVGREL